MKKSIYKSLRITSILVFFSLPVWSKQNIGQGKTNENANNGQGKTTASCAQATAETDLDINNVRAKIMNGGDMWWDRGLGSARYEVPKGSTKQSLFAGSIWVGGYTSGGTLKVAAQTYRQGGNDYWPGPIVGADNPNQDPTSSCLDWDKIWKINKTEILLFIDEVAKGNVPSSSDSRFVNIFNWPAYGNSYATGKNGVSLATFLNASTKSKIDFAPFIDKGGDPGKYDPDQGDYPAIFGDQYLWWIFNDAGNVKNETGSQALNIEIQASAFAFITNDQLNNASFYNYKLFNKGVSLDSCYIATWTDADLGYAFDDFVGCDTTKDLGFIYNGDAMDGSGLPSQYGSDIPMQGIDFFEGPVKPKVGDPYPKQMAAFTFYNNDFTDKGNPTAANHYYQYMTGTWKNGLPFTFSCNAADPGPASKFVYPGDPSKEGSWQSNWSECNCKNSAADRRFIHSSGPFNMSSNNAVPINVTIGAIWANGFTYPCPSIGPLLLADFKAQDAFDRGFKLLEGPQAPKLTIRELDQKLVLYISNPGSINSNNNFNELYGRTDSTKFGISKVASKMGLDSVYRFQGYKIYQVIDSTTTIGDIYNSDGSINVDVARLAFQCDIKDTVSGAIVNHVEIPELSGSSASGTSFRPVEKARPTNTGLQHSFVVTQDLFNDAGGNLVNYKKYYYIAVSYAYNMFKKFDYTINSQDIPYLESSKNYAGNPVRAVTGIPNSAYTNFGNSIHADYGDGVIIETLEGQGNGGNDVELSEGTVANILANNQDYTPTYKAGQGPINVKVVDPVKLQPVDFKLVLKGPSSVYKYNGSSVIDNISDLKGDSCFWELTDVTNNKVIYSENNINTINEQILAEYGISLNINQKPRPGDDFNTMGSISNSLIFDDPSKPWLTSFGDNDGEFSGNWIRGGSNMSDTEDPDGPGPYVKCDFNDFAKNNTNDQFLDPFGVYEKVIDGSWAPYALVANDNRATCGFGLAYADYETAIVKNNNTVTGYFNRSSPIRNFNPIQKTTSVDIIFTSDRSKWSKCVVVEMRDNQSNATTPFNPQSEGGAAKFNLRKHASLMLEAGSNGGFEYDNTSSGFSYFPGYAINPETGERLNIFFGEDSYLTSENGRDMVWNPSSKIFGGFNPVGNLEALFGGKHTIFVSNSKYDGCAEIYSNLKADEAKGASNTATSRFKVFSNVSWIGNTFINPLVKMNSWKDGFIPTETKVRIRVDKPYQVAKPDPSGTYPNKGNPTYQFSTKNLVMTNWAGGTKQETNDLLKKIRMTPNPYYGVSIGSGYQYSNLDRVVKIINLPQKATVNIYTLDGVLVKNFNKDDNLSYIDWNLKNNARINIGSGAYLVHVKAEGIGETIIKFFAVMRPEDITTF